MQAVQNHPEATPEYWAWVRREVKAGRMTILERRLRTENADLDLYSVGEIVDGTLGVLDEIEAS